MEKVKEFKPYTITKWTLGTKSDLSVMTIVVLIDFYKLSFSLFVNPDILGVSRVAKT